MTDLRNTLYDKKILPVHDFSIPIVSVGNLTVGGTGKTPIICELLRWALEQSLRPGVVSRGYCRTGEGIVRVPLSAQGVEFGDEPAMMARRFSTVPVYVGSDRVDAAKVLIAREDVQIIFADDAFQHRRLGRRVDIVILDCMEAINNYASLPLGRAREDKSALRRAHFIILNKCNLATPEQKKLSLEFIDQVCGDLQVPVIESDYYCTRLVRLDGLVQDKIDGYEKVVLLSGVGSPLSFEVMMNKGFDIKKHFIFKDHHAYKSQEIQSVIDESKSLGVQKIVTTEKDAVKLFQFMDIKEKIWVAELSPKLSLRIKSLYEKISAQLK